MADPIRTTVECLRSEDVDLAVDFALVLEAGDELTGDIDIEIGEPSGGGHADRTAQFVGTPAPSLYAATGETALTRVRWRTKAAATGEQLRLRDPGYVVMVTALTTAGHRVGPLPGRLVVHDEPFFAGS